MPARLRYSYQRQLIRAWSASGCEMAKRKSLSLTPTQLSKARAAIEVLTVLTSSGEASVRTTEERPGSSHINDSKPGTSREREPDTRSQQPKSTREGI